MLASIVVTTSLAMACYLIVDPGLTLVDAFLGSSVDFLHRGQSTGELTELSGRSEMWAKMWKSYLDSPIVGHGYFVCSSTGELYVWFTTQNHTAHNAILQSLVTTGLVGFLIFILWHISLFLMLIKTTISKLTSPVNQCLVPPILLWFVCWCLLNSSILGPVRPESVVYAITVGLLVGQYQALQNAQHLERIAQPSLSAQVVSDREHAC